MSQIKPVPSIMVLSETSDTHQLFRFRKEIWAIGTLIFGAVFSSLFLLPFMLNQSLPDATGRWLMVILAFFDLLLIYSLVYTLNAEQWLNVDGVTRRARFFWKSVYGTTAWEIDGASFREIRVFRACDAESGRSMNWTIMLVHPDGTGLCLGENEFGSFNHERALVLASRVGKMLGISVSDQA